MLLNLAEIAEQGEGALMQTRGDSEALVDELDTLLCDAVRSRMAADVPLGTFLSGGFDSTMVAALMQAQASRRIKTFTTRYGLNYKYCPSR